VAKSVFTKIEGGIGLQVEVMISAEDIAKRVRELGEEITRDYDSKDLVVVGILKGAVVFMSDLIRVITVPLEVDFMATSSYVCPHRLLELYSCSRT
jgi:hypoxanthine phosphoribosyltransferase